MRAVVVITDSDVVKEFERAFLEAGRGFTVLPTLAGHGRTGLKAGDRVHPGSSGLLFTIVRDGELDATVEFLRGIRDRAAAAPATRIFVAPVEEVR